MVVTLMDYGTVVKMITCNVALVLEKALIHWVVSPSRGFGLVASKALRRLGSRYAGFSFDFIQPCLDLMTITIC